MRPASALSIRTFWRCTLRLHNVEGEQRIFASLRMCEEAKLIVVNARCRNFTLEIFLHSL